jgi:hypothetical protein
MAIVMFWTMSQPDERRFMFMTAMTKQPLCPVQKPGMEKIPLHR